MVVHVRPNGNIGRDGGSFQECDFDTSTNTITRKYGRYCTIRDNESAPPTSTAGRYWVQIYRTPDNTE